MRKTHLVLLVACIFAVGCRSSRLQYLQHEVHEGDNDWNYRRVFGAAPPPDVAVTNSIVVIYSCARMLACWDMTMTDDFEFELLAPSAWIREGLDAWGGPFSSVGPLWGLRKGDDEFIKRDLGARIAHRYRPWYAPKPLNAYDLYRDLTSAGYIHMLVDKEMVGDRHRVFVSKH